MRRSGVRLPSAPPFPQHALKAARPAVGLLRRGRAAGHFARSRRAPAKVLPKAARLTGEIHKRSHSKSPAGAAALLSREQFSAPVDCEAVRDAWDDCSRSRPNTGATTMNFKSIIPVACAAIAISG